MSRLPSRLLATHLRLLSPSHTLLLPSPLPLRSFHSSASAHAKPKSPLTPPPPPPSPYESPADWAHNTAVRRLSKRIVYTLGGKIPRVSEEEWAKGRMRRFLVGSLSGFMVIVLGTAVWEEVYGVEPIYTSGVYRTKIRLPTREDPDNIREDVWKIVTRKRAEFLLKRRESSTTYEREGNPVKRVDTSALQSNERMEDRSAERVLSGLKEGEDLCFFAVFDGHSGHATSEFVSKTLLPTVELSLSSLHAGSLQSPFEPVKPRTVRSILADAKSWLFDDSFGGGKAAARDWKSPLNVETALKRSFEVLDNAIVWDPVRLLEKISTSPTEVPDALDPLATILSALSGSCALLTYIDTAANDLYVALAGDCRAVAGYWVEKEQKWRVEVLSDDQTGRNPRELERIQSEHPASERDDVVRRGRILGGLEPSRAFGDARYKWPADLQPKLYDKLLPPNHKRPRPPSANLKTPPYVTARPEVTHRKLALGPEAAASETGELRFLVMATDGLFDRLSNHAIVALLGQRLSEPYSTGKIRKSEVMANVITNPEDAGFDGKKKMKKKDEETEFFWFGKDENAATFLIRNSLAGGDEEAFLRLMSVKPPISRYQRDDTTVKVIFFSQPPPPVTTEPPPPTLSLNETRAKSERGPLEILLGGASTYREE